MSDEMKGDEALKLADELAHSLMHTIADFCKDEPRADDPDVVLPGIIEALRISLEHVKCAGCRELKRKLCESLVAISIDEAMKAPTDEPGDKNHLH